MLSLSELLRQYSKLFRLPSTARVPDVTLAESCGNCCSYGDHLSNHVFSPTPLLQFEILSVSSGFPPTLPQSFFVVKTVGDSFDDLPLSASDEPRVYNSQSSGFDPQIYNPAVLPMFLSDPPVTKLWKMLHASKDLIEAMQDSSS
ncbi:hypothetical protein Tco_0443444 [Tanacetum coccineum]